MRSASAVLLGSLLAACGSPPSAPPPQPPPTPAPASWTIAPADPYTPPPGLDPALLRQATLAPGDPEAKCRADGPHLRRCLQARANPDLPLQWTLTWDQGHRDEHGHDVQYTVAELEARRQTVIDRLRADGARDITTMQSFPWMVLVTATHVVVRGAMAMPAVDHVDVACADDQGVCACAQMRLDQCEHNAFCSPLRAVPLDATGCPGPPALVGCTRAEVCSDVSTTAFDPTGALWQFPNSCMPDQPGWRRPTRDLRLAWRSASPCPHP